MIDDFDDSENSIFLSISCSSLSRLSREIKRRDFSFSRSVNLRLTSSRDLMISSFLTIVVLSFSSGIACPVDKGMHSNMPLLYMEVDLTKWLKGSPGL